MLNKKHCFKLHMSKDSVPVYNQNKCGRVNHKKTFE